MRKLILQNHQSPGDIVMLTAAVRDLHLTYPGEFVTDISSSCPDLWLNNPYLTPLDRNESGVEVIDCHYPLIHQSNRAPWHFLHGFTDYLNERLSLAIRPTAFRGDIHLSPEEKHRANLPPQLTFDNKPYWMIVAGGKTDFTIKWWSPARFQRVVDFFSDRITFVQVGSAGHVHPALDGVIDLRGKTSLRDLVRLVYHSSGVVTPVSLLMHLAAAVDYPDNDSAARPCVVVAGGREPPHWEAYPPHQYVHTVGMLPCCASGGCWKSRTRALGDGAEQDSPSQLCVDVVGDLPRCMHMIEPHHVIERMNWYLQTTMRRREPVHPAVADADRFLESIESYPGGFQGSGIVICGGGPRYFPSAWIAIRRLRDIGCHLPIELWHLGQAELDSRMRSLVGGLGVRAVDGFSLRLRHPIPHLGGWELKPYAMLHSAFQHVLLLDADNFCYRDPTALFDGPEYRSAGAVFWPDLERLGPERSAWKVFGVPYRNEWAFESGQILLNKAQCWNALSLTVWYNANSPYFYQHVYGDKDTFHMAFRKLEMPYAMPSRPAEVRDGIITQYDFSGASLFQHRIKWSLDGCNEQFQTFPFFAECAEYLKELRELWDGSIRVRKSRSVLRPAWSFGER